MFYDSQKKINLSPYCISYKIIPDVLKIYSTILGCREESVGIQIDEIRRTHGLPSARELFNLWQVSYEYSKYVDPQGGFQFYFDQTRKQFVEEAGWRFRLLDPSQSLICHQQNLNLDREIRLDESGIYSVKANDDLKSSLICHASFLKGANITENIFTMLAHWKIDPMKAFYKKPIFVNEDAQYQPEDQDALLSSGINIERLQSLAEVDFSSLSKEARQLIKDCNIQFSKEFLKWHRISHNSSSLIISYRTFDAFNYHDLINNIRSELNLIEE